MQKAALLLSVVALAVSGWLLSSRTSSGVEVERLRRDLDALATLEARVGALEHAPAESPRPPPPATVLGAPPAAAEAVASAAPDGAPAGAPRAATTPARVADLEKRLAALEEKASAVAPGSFRLNRAAMTGPNGGRLYASVDDAKDDLDLTDLQKGDFERILADARREIDDLHKTPDDEGKTWEQAQREMFSSEGGALRFDLSRLESFRRKTVPGRSETYGQADQRIREAAKRRLRDTLSTAQQEKFDKASTEPLLGGGGGAAFVSVGFTTDAKPADGK